MSSIRIEMSMFLESFVTAGNVRPDEPIGDGGRCCTNGPSAATKPVRGDLWSAGGRIRSVWPWVAK